MIRKMLHTIMAPRHPWRKVSFSELSEMYLTVFLRTVAIAMVGIFVPLYLLKSGYRFTDVIGFYVLFYMFGMLYDVIAAHLIARFGPKHVMRISFLFQIVFSISLANLKSIPFAIFTLAAIAALASTLYFMSYHVDFSKIKHTEHGGKELGFIQIMERVASIIGPIGGGLLATLVAPQAAFWAAAVAMFFATIVLMLTPEPVQTHQKLRFRGLNLRKEWRDYCSFAAVCVDGTATILLWPVYLSAVVFVGGAYVKLGGIASLSVLIAIVVAVPLGRLLDKQRGHLMLKYGTAANAATHLSRLLVSGMPGAVVVSSVNEPVTLTYRMAYLKGYYDSADDHPGYRISYIMVHELLGDVSRTLFWLLLLVLSLFCSAYATCAIGFVIAAIASMLIRLERFKAIR